jgi:hypothetical protein
MIIPPIRVSVILLILFCSTIVMAQNKPATGDVYLKNGGTVNGIILDITTNAVKLDPPGPVSLRTILSSEIDSIVIPDLDTTLIFPLQNTGLTPKVGNYLRQSKNSGKSPVSFALSLTGGLSAFGLDYYEGYTHGPSFEGELRLYLNLDDEADSHPYIAIAYRHSSAGVDSDLKKTLYGYTGDGYPVYIVMEPLSVTHVGFRVGIASKKKLAGSSSQYSFHVGLSMLSNEGSGRSEVEIGSAHIILSRASISDDKLGFNMAFSFIKGIKRSMGLRFSFGYELFITNVEKDPYGYEYYDKYYGGGALLFDGGLIFEF